MPIDNIHLRKLLKMLFLEPKARRAALKADIRDEIRREAGITSKGGDFYAPFWADAKDHVFGIGNLDKMTADRLAMNKRRLNLYPQLRSGFLIWWNERRRWTNEPFRQGQTLKTRFSFPGLDAVIKIDGILSVRDGMDVEHVVYPYFAPDPALSENGARLGLWLLITALPSFPLEEIRILDVIRGRTFSTDRNPLIGSEEEEFRRRYKSLIDDRAVLKGSGK